MNDFAPRTLPPRPMLSREDIRPCDMCRKPHPTPVVWKVKMERIGHNGDPAPIRGGVTVRVKSIDFGAFVLDARDFIICESCALDTKMGIMVLEPPPT